MEKLVMIGNIENIARQRNVFMLLAIVSIIACLILSLKLILTEEKVILVPGLNQEVWTSGKGVSKSYLEETTAMFLPLLLDLNADSIDWKREHLFTHVSQSDERYMKSLTEYFAVTKEKYKQFSLSTHFAAKSFEINEKQLTVKVFGQLTSRYGERGYQSVLATYGLGFEWVAGKLMLTEFVKLSKEGEINVTNKEQVNE